MKNLTRDEFFGHEKILKLTSLINRRTKNGFYYLIIKDTDLINLIINNDDWFDYIGITITKVDDNIKIKWKEIQ